VSSGCGHAQERYVRSIQETPGGPRRLIGTKANNDDRTAVDDDTVVASDHHDERHERVGTQAGERVDEESPVAEPVVATPAEQREEFGGLHLGACILGWLSGVGLAVILLGIVGAVAAAVGDGVDFTQDDFERTGAELSTAAAITAVVLLAIAYGVAGYVAGRMSRFHGFRQGLGVWLVGVVVIGIATAVGLIFGDQYDVLQRVDLPEVPVPDDDLTTGAIATGAAALAATLIAALIGGKVGTRFHRRIDRF
jgi:hypothetical protein